MKPIQCSKAYCYAVYIYLFLPFVIFIMGWMKIYYAIPLIGVICVCLFRMARDTSLSDTLECKVEKKDKLFFIIIIVILWVAVSGIGGFAFQTEDHIWRNAMFENLVYDEWPVIRDVEMDGMIQNRGMSYYIGFWLPAALIGKVFGLGIGLYAQVIWAVIGILLFYFGICYVKKRILIWPLLVFIFFSGMDIVGNYLTGSDIFALSQTSHLEWWSKFQFSSMTTQLFWVYNQAIPAWLITIFLYLQKKNRYMIFLLSTAMLYCTMPFIGLLPLCIYWIFSRRYEKIKKEYWSWWIKDTFTMENILGGGAIGFFSFLYLIKSGGTDESTYFPMNNGGWLVYIVFLLVEIGGMCIALYQHQKRNILYYILIVWFCLCPILPVYGGANFCMRASIPALVMLYVLFIQSFETACREKHKTQFVGMAMVFFLGAVTPLYEINRNISETQRRYISQSESVRAESVDMDRVLQNAYESTNVQENFFFKYLAK